MATSGVSTFELYAVRPGKRTNGVPAVNYPRSYGENDRDEVALAVSDLGLVATLTTNIKL